MRGDPPPGHQSETPLTRWLVVVLVAAIVPLMSGCRLKNEDAPPAAATAEVDRDPSLETFALGADVTTTGSIPKDAEGETFTRGSEVYLSVDVRSASRSQEIAVIWLDNKGREIKRQKRDVPPEVRYAPFSSGSTATWRTGSYRALVVIDGRRATEKVFELM